MKKKPNIIAIAGFDPSGGAGVLADIKTISALGGYGRGVVTCATAQSSKGVKEMTCFGDNIVANQLDSILSDLKVSAIKIGVVSNPDSIIEIAKTLKLFRKYLSFWILFCRHLQMVIDFWGRPVSQL